MGEGGEEGCEDWRVWSAVRKSLVESRVWESIEVGRVRSHFHIVWNWVKELEMGWVSITVLLPNLAPK